MNTLSYISDYCTAGGELQACLQGVYNMGLALAVALAFLIILRGAFKYLLGAIPNQKADGKGDIINALVGLAIIAVSGTVLYWVNPHIFNAELITYKVTELTVPKLDLQFTEEFGPTIKPSGPISSSAPSVSPQNVIAMAEFAKWSTTDPGRAEFRKNTSNATACNYFVAYVLTQAGFLNKNQCVRAAEFNTFLKNKGWQELPFDKNNVRIGDVLVRTRLSSGGYGHIAIATSNNEIAHASYGSKEPRLTGIKENSFNYILRK